MNNNNYSEEENSSAIVSAVLTSVGGEPQITTLANLFVVGSAEG